MAKDPAFLFYPGDWLGGTMGMTFEEKGAYFELLLMQWHCRRITTDNAKKLVGETLWLKLMHKFESDGGGFFNKRMETEVEKRRKHSEKQKINAEKRWGNNKSNGNATAMPLENINKNGNEVQIVDKGGSGENWQAIKKKWIDDFRWKEKICRDKNIQMPFLEQKLKDFITDLELKEDYKPIQGLKNHFINWYNKHYNGSTAHKSVIGGSKAGVGDSRIEALANFGKPKTINRP